MSACAACGRETRAEARFCDHCADELERFGRDPIYEAAVQAAAA